MQRFPLKIVSWIASIGYVLIFSELFLRFYAPVPVMPRYVMVAPYGVRMNVPNRTYWQTTPETHIRFHINSAGMRSDRDYAIAKPAHVCRVLMLGDSFFMGYEVDLRDSIQDKLEQSLRESGYPCEVINLAVSGMGPAESLIAYRNFGKKFEPDIVVLETHRTNLDNNVRSGLFTLRDGKLVQTAASYLPGVRVSGVLQRSRLYCWISENSQLYSAVREKLAAFMKSAVVFARTGQIDTPAGESTGEDGKAAMDDKRALNLAIIEELEREVKPARLIMAEIPDKNSRTSFSSFNPIDPSRNHYRETGQYVTVIDELRQGASQGKTLYYERGEGHMTPAGVALIVDKLAAALRQLPELARYRQPSASITNR